MHHVFMYDTEVTNQDNGYSKHTGAYAALSHGVYAFCYMAFASDEHVAGLWRGICPAGLQRRLPVFYLC